MHLIDMICYLSSYTRVTNVDKFSLLTLSLSDWLDTKFIDFYDSIYVNGFNLVLKICFLKFISPRTRIIYLFN
jgi:hypothetical protein